MNKVLVTGASGLLGRSIFKKFKSEKWETIGTSLRRKQNDLISLDLTDLQAVQDCFFKYKPNYIIHCAAEKSPDICQNDPAKTQNINVNATQYLAKLSKEISAKLIYISTDYVFDGTQPPYQTFHIPNPINAYGLSKRAGEIEVIKENPQSIILRVPVLYGPIENLEESAVTTIFSTVLKKSPLKNDHWAIRYPTYTPDIADAILKIASLPTTKPIKGIFHFSGNEPFTKYEIAKIMAEVFKLSHQHIQPDPNPSSGAPRPKNCHLDSQELKKIIDFQLTSFRTAIKEVLTPFLPENA